MEEWRKGNCKEEVLAMKKHGREGTMRRKGNVGRKEEEQMK